MTTKNEFLTLAKTVEQTKIFDRLSSVTSAEELKKIWQKFRLENADLISKIQEWEANHLYAEFDGYNIFSSKDSIEYPIGITICIMLMKDPTRELDIFECEDDLSDALGKIKNKLARNFSRISYENFLSDIKAENLMS